MVHSSPLWLSPETLIAKLNRLEDRIIIARDPVIRTPSKPLWLPLRGTKQVNSVVKYPLYREIREEDQSMARKLLCDDDQKIGYIFFESGKVVFGDGDEDVRCYELLHLRLDYSLDRGEFQTLEAPRKIQVHAENEGYSPVEITRRDYVRNFGIWTKRSAQDIPTDAFMTRPELLRSVA